MSATTLKGWACAESVTLALGITDIVGSSTLNRKLGNRIWNEALSQHERRARELTSQFDCREIKGTGDGFIIVFRTAMDALEFALELHANTGHSDIRIRVGIHVGAVRIKENDIQGGMVNLTARIVGWRTRVRSLPEMQDLIVLSDTAKEHIDEELGISSSRFRFLPYDAELKDFGKRRLWVAITSEMKRRYVAERGPQSSRSASVPNQATRREAPIAPKWRDVLPTYSPPNPDSVVPIVPDPQFPRRKLVIREALKKPSDDK